MSDEEMRKLLVQLQTSGVLPCCDTHDGDTFETMRDEDTPEVAVARNREVSKLKDRLLALTRMCPLIQREPENAMTRFLFSAELGKIGHEQDELQDVLLPTRVFYDESICRELKKVGLTDKQQHDVCEQLCAQSIQSVEFLRELQKGSGSHSDVRITRKSHSQFQVCWESECLLISDYHLKALRNMYNTKNDPTQQYFNQRIFSLLMRYKTVGGPMYQCSVTQQAFGVLQREFEVTKECMASPFNHNADVYWSAFRDTDGHFGSQGSFFTSLESPLVTQGGSFYANPPFVEEILHLFTRHIQEILKFSVPVSFICLFPTWPDHKSYNDMKNRLYCKQCVVLEPRKHAYVDGNQQVNTGTTKKHHVPQFKTTLFVVQNEMGSKKWPVTEHNMRAVLASFAVM
jgi:hypothetical protein